jgi:hypothetical protein
MPSGVNIPLTFEIYKGDSLVKTETLTQDIIKIGKLSSSHLRVDDESVSRMHAVIEVTQPNEIYIIDLGSTKGTLVNGQKVNKAKLQSGDTIVLGTTKIVVTIGEPIAAADDGPTQVQASPVAPPPSVKSTQMGLSAIKTPSAFPPAPSAPPPAPSAAPPVPVASAPVPPPVAAPAPPPLAHAPAPGGLPPPFASPHAAAARQAPAAAAASFNAPTGAGYDASAVELQDGSRAIEVTAMFEDAVVDVHHFTDPKGGQVTGATKGLLFGGAGALIASLVVFVVAFIQVAQQKAIKEAWEAQGKPLSDLPVQHDGPLFDIIFGTLFVFGIVTLIMGMVRLFTERRPRDFTIGSDPKALFKAASEVIPSGAFPLVHSTGSDYELIFTSQMHGDASVDGQNLSLEQLVGGGRAHASSVVGGAYAWAIPNGARVKIDVGQNTFLVSSVPPPRHYPNPLAVDWGQQSYTAGTALVFGLFLALIFSMPPDPKSLSLDAFMNDQRFAKFLIKPPEEKQEEIPDWLKKKNDDEAGGKGKRHKGEEGKMGKKTSKNKAGLYALKGPPDNKDMHLAKQLAEEAAQKAGVLGMLKANEGSHLASIFGRDSALGSDAQDVLGSLVGTSIGEANGAGGLGLVGSGVGGGGTGEGTIGLGNLGTIGKGGGGGNGSGYGRGMGGLSGRRASAPDVVPGTATVKGSLDKEIIRRIIRRHLNEVKFCYEKELLKKSDLYGRIMIQFTIAGTGSVVASVVQNSTMNNSEVEQCIAGAVRRWEFPKPQGGGIVIVSYPFVLKAAGAE